MAKKPLLKKGDWVWELTKVTRVELDEAGEIQRVTTELPSGHLDTKAYNPDKLKPADA